MKLRELLRKINDAVRPVHVQGSRDTYDRLGDAKATAYGGGSNANPISHSSHDEKPPH
jgi:hypothetical protein